MESTRLKKLLSKVAEYAKALIVQAECDEIDGIYGCIYSLWIDNACEVPARDFDEFSEEAFEVVEDICQENSFAVSKWNDECFEIYRPKFDPDAYYVDQRYTQKRDEAGLVW